MSCKRTPPVAILHQASGWILLADLNTNYCFPVDIAFNQLKVDITIFSNNLRKVILTELTWLCEEKFLTSLTSYQSQHGCKKEFNQTFWPNFLWSLKCKLSNIRGVSPDFNTKQDLAEILQVVLDQLKCVSLEASQLISNAPKTKVSCNTCFCFCVRGNSWNNTPTSISWHPNFYQSLS